MVKDGKTVSGVREGIKFHIDWSEGFLEKNNEWKLKGMN